MNLLANIGHGRKSIVDPFVEPARGNRDGHHAAGAVGRNVRYAKAADDFDELATILLPHIAALGSWLGTAGYALLKLAGISP